MENAIEKWSCFEAVLHGPDQGNPFTEVTVSAQFRHDDKMVTVNGFYDGSGLYRIRFMPDLIGKWTYLTESPVADLNKKSGSFVCVSSSADNHGPVRVRGQFHFAYADEKPYYPFGTTCYAWIHQSKELQEKTLNTLSGSSFNKMRMCVFPKHYEYNHNEPELFPYEGSIKTGFDFKRFNPAFFRHMEERILDLQRLGIECDLILFHPYDRWGFSRMGRENDDLYLRYIVSRLSAFRNIWWSLANEFDLMETVIPGINETPAKKAEDWDRFAFIIRNNDPRYHLMSVHNCSRMFDHKKPWVTHCSIQRIDVYRTAENTDQWRKEFDKPVVIDECAYEGNIDHGWGNITGQEMTRRFWEGVLRGGYVGHGETYMHPQNILWWSHGGELHGSSPARIAFLKKILENAPSAIEPVARSQEGFDPNWDVTVGKAGENYFLYYFGFNQPSFRTFNMPEGIIYHVDIIDTWDMTIVSLPGIYRSDFRIDLPAKQYIAVRIQSLS
jgi:hypothetical protein